MQTQNSLVPYFRWLILTALTICLSLGTGCHRPPQIGQENRRLITSLRTAVTSHKVDWLDLNANAIDDCHVAGSLSDDQYVALKSIIDQARAGNWTDAETELIRLAKAQQPTRENSKDRDPPMSHHRPGTK